ncbi:hypothetical protein [Salinibacterium sp. ZJ450]|uniref:hypothetical protein n=1 Tax=Salinibacterium sp. ZJ450 TaxID=2708338 RepID=UPI00141F26EF|nr:hypothetical protein [Salinibacterium sp. ZJ450]
MEIAVLITNIGLFAATVIAAIIAWRSVSDAREARDEAKRHEAAALAAAINAADAAVRSADEHKRAADALERQADIAESATAKPPWHMERVAKTRWKLTNQSGANADFVDIKGEPDGHLQVEDEQPWRDIAKGASVFFQFGGGMTDPGSINVRINWRDPIKGGREAVVTIP